MLGGVEIAGRSEGTEMNCQHLEVKERLLAGKPTLVCANCGTVCNAPGKAVEIVVERGRAQRQPLEKE